MAQSNFALPLAIAVTGHRDLVAAEIPGIRARVRALLALGGSALDEHAEWILMHRDRLIDQGEIWRLGS